MTPIQGLRSAFRRGSLTTPHHTLAAIAFAGSVTALAAAAFPPTPEAPVPLLAAIGGAVLAASAAVWVLGDRLSLRVLEIGTAVGILAISGVVARSGTSFGAIVASSSYLWLAVYSGFFFPRLVARAQLALIAAGFGAALMLGHQGVPFSAWVFMTSSLVVAGEVVGRQSALLRHEARTDSLTGALNRKGLELAAKRIFSLGDRTGLPLTLLLIDLDDFKQVNDSKGHQAGDRLLVELTNAWAEELDPADILVRLGGDEFLILLVGSTEDERMQLLDRLRSVSSASWSVGEVSRRPAETLSSCLARADTALYGSKRRQTGSRSDRGRKRPRLTTARG